MLSREALLDAALVAVHRSTLLGEQLPLIRRRDAILRHDRILHQHIPFLLLFDLGSWVVSAELWQEHVGLVSAFRHVTKVSHVITLFISYRRRVLQYALNLHRRLIELFDEVSS